LARRTRPTIIDVARLAEVSPTTVSYVLSKTSRRANRISEATRLRVLDAVAEIGYAPNQSARALRLQRSSRVLFLGGRFTSLYSQTIAQSLEPALVGHGLALDIQIGAGPIHLERAIAALDQNQVDGLIVENDGEGMSRLRDAATRGHAIVAIGSVDHDPGFDTVSHDDVPAIQQAMDHLIQRGFRRIVLLSRNQQAPWEHRIAVANDHLIARGVPAAAILICHCEHDRIVAHDAARAYLPRLEGPIAVYAGSDVSAIGVLWAATRLGRRVPDDVRIVGHGNTPELDITVPRLTSLGPISHDFSSAAELMVSRLRDPTIPGRHITAPWQFSAREST
jgi:LacI family transcriptional regulator